MDSACSMIILEYERRGSLCAYPTALHGPAKFGISNPKGSDLSEPLVVMLDIIPATP